MARDTRDLATLWELLESSKRNLKALCRLLEQLPKDRLERYRDEYEEAKSQINPCYWDDCHPHLGRSCSEDHGDDFAAWVVMHGEPFFEAVRAHPEEIEAYLDRFDEAEIKTRSGKGGWDNEVDLPEYQGWVRADYIASRIYTERFGKK
jgi:hypothetical protein